MTASLALLVGLATNVTIGYETGISGGSLAKTPSKAGRLGMALPNPRPMATNALEDWARYRPPTR